MLSGSQGTNPFSAQLLPAACGPAQFQASKHWELRGLSCTQLCRQCLGRKLLAGGRWREGSNHRQYGELGVDL